MLFRSEVAIIGKTMGPWTLGYHCFGVEPFLLMSLDDPGKMKLCLDRMKEATVQFGVAQIEAGADALTLPDHATGDLVSGEYYERFLKDLHIEMVSRIPAPPAGMLFIAYGDLSSRLMGGDTHGSGMPTSKGMDVELTVL